MCSCCQYYGLTSDIYFCGRALQSLIPSASGDASYICFQGRVGHVFCETGLFRENLSRRQSQTFLETPLQDANLKPFALSWIYSKGCAGLGGGGGTGLAAVPLAIRSFALKVVMTGTTYAVVMRAFLIKSRLVISCPSSDEESF